MKHNILLALGAMVVLGLSSCVEQANVNPTYNPQTNMVNTQFVLNIAAADKVETKQPTEVTQLNGNFRGIENATLFCFQVPTTGDKIMPYGEGNDWGNSLTSIDLSSALLEGAIDPLRPEGETTPPLSHRVMSLSIPVGTNAMMFYGMANKTTKDGSPVTRDSADVGQMFYIFPSNNIAEIGSYAGARLRDYQVADFNKYEAILLSVVNHMLRIGVGGTDPWDNEVVYYPSSSTKKAHIHWADYLVSVEAKNGKYHSPLAPNNDNLGPSPLETILGSTFKTFTTVVMEGDKVKEARSGSAASLARQLNDIRFIATDGAQSTAVSDEDRIAIKMCEVIRDYINTFLRPGDEWKEISDVLKYAGTAPDEPGEDEHYYDFVAEDGLSAPSDKYGIVLTPFPRNFNLPVGVAVLEPTTKTFEDRQFRQFIYKSNPATQSAIADQSVTDVTYPPELCYYGNSPLRISEASGLENSSFPDGTDAWSDDGEWEDLGVWKAGFNPVTTSTRGIAMANNIQYGMALLETNLQFALTAVTEGTALLDDNAKAVAGEEKDAVVKANANNPIRLKGIMIGGQPSLVNWQYLGWEDHAGFNRNKMVYDNSMQGRVGNEEGVKIPTNGTITNYTVLFDNYESGTQAEAVYVALELVNNTGTSFYGETNLIKNGATFYLPASIELSKGDKSKITWPEDYDEMMPPYYTSGENKGKTIREPRIFMQDRVTKVTFTLGKNCLKKAILTVPDLRVAQMQVGISVDLTWEDGMSQAIGL